MIALYERDNPWKIDITNVELKAVGAMSCRKATAYDRAPPVPQNTDRRADIARPVGACVGQTMAGDQSLGKVRRQRLAE